MKPHVDRNCTLTSLSGFHLLTQATMLKQKSVYLMQAMFRARRAALSPRESAAVPIVCLYGFCFLKMLLATFNCLETTFNSTSTTGNCTLTSDYLDTARCYQPRPAFILSQKLERYRSVRRNSLLIVKVCVPEKH